MNNNISALQAELQKLSQIVQQKRGGLATAQVNLDNAMDAIKQRYGCLTWEEAQLEYDRIHNSINTLAKKGERLVKKAEELLDEITQKTGAHQQVTSGPSRPPITGAVSRSRANNLQ